MIVLHSEFARAPFGHGGERRSAQIQRLLVRHGLECPQLEELAKAVQGRWLAKVFLAASLRTRYQQLRGSARTFGKLGGDALRILPIFRSEAPGVLVWESGGSQRLHIPVVARRAGWKVIAVPHNLESLVPTQRSHRSGGVSPHWLPEEIAMLSQCDRVFTIAREEQWLLQLHGIAADFLPYQPSGRVTASLRAIRSRRASRSPASPVRNLLMIGTYGNPPTRRGMLALVREWPKLQAEWEAKCVLNVAGYGSERIAADLSLPQHVNLHGEVDNERLDRLLVEADAVLLHQEPSSGALTRIPEMLIAGVPVLANAAAARSWFRQEGVSVYESLADLKQLLQSPLAMPPEPAAPTAEEQRFLEAVRTLESAARTEPLGASK